MPYSYEMIGNTMQRSTLIV